MINTEVLASADKILEATCSDLCFTLMCQTIPNKEESTYVCLCVYDRCIGNVCPNQAMKFLIGTLNAAELKNVNH